ncbi:hypothetical protein TRICI_000553 [Trichomonascus ciferrii]|uniref:Uncharacterized protein n=1 Tax=Trichomonascus ciferrii TaxID=44093 RepID=A0A642VD05_9ASCO|nr:hypothetical protein TRICI_000553 [Trichomonascus ciferrii]
MSSTEWWPDPSDPAAFNDAGFPLFDGSLQNSNNFPLVTDSNDPIPYSHIQQLRQSYYNGTKDFYLQNYPYRQQSAQIHDATPVQQQHPLPPQPPVIDHNYSQYDTLYDNIMVWNDSHEHYQPQPMNISLSAPTRLHNNSSSNPTPPPPPAQAITTNGNNRGLGLFIDNGNDKQTQQYMHNTNNHYNTNSSSHTRNPDPQKFVHPPPRPPTYPPNELTFVHEANNFANKSSTNKIAKKKKSTTNLRRNNNQQKNVLMSVNDQLSTNQAPPPPPQLQTPLKTKSSEPKSSPTTIPMKTSTGCIQKVTSSIPDNDLSISPTPMAKSSSMFAESTQFHDNSSPPKGVFINKHNRTPDLFSDFKDLEKSGEEITSKYFQNPQTLFAKQQQQQQHDVSKSIAAFGSKPWNLDDEATKLIQQSDFLHRNNSNDIESL